MVGTKKKQTKVIWIFIDPEILTQNNCPHHFMCTNEEVCITDGKYKNVFSLETKMSFWQTSLDCKPNLAHRFLRMVFRINLASKL